MIVFSLHNIDDGLTRILYTNNHVTSAPFIVNQKHRTLLRMDDEELPSIYVEVTTTDFMMLALFVEIIILVMHHFLLLIVDHDLSLIMLTLF
jgi:hypothetical protein